MLVRNTALIPTSLRVFSTCVESSDVPGEAYVKHARTVARWSEEVGCEGMLIYTDNRLVDPWLVAQIALENTERLCPLVAVQPIYMHPYSVAKMVASLGSMYGRKLALNMLAGGFRNDLLALADTTLHDRRYDRMVEYTRILIGLLAGNSVSFEGEFYAVTRLKMTPQLPVSLQPEIFVSGSSEAGLAAARTLDAVAVQYPTEPAYFGDVSLDEQLRYGIRVGIVAREDPAQAWSIAGSRFPTDRKGQLTRQLADRTSDSKWHHELTAQAARSSEEPTEQRSSYWMVPFSQYKTMCPYLVGSYEQVAELLQTYIDKGYETFILDIPPSRDELDHTGRAFELCREGRA
jgi:alkanesulfonate monooxygenase